MEFINLVTENEELEVQVYLPSFPFRLICECIACKFITPIRYVHYMSYLYINYVHY